MFVAVVSVQSRHSSSSNLINLIHAIKITNKFGYQKCRLRYSAMLCKLSTRIFSLVNSRSLNGGENPDEENELDDDVLVI